MAYPGGFVSIPKPTGWQDIEVVNIYRIVNTVEVQIETLYSIPYTDSGTGEGATRVTANIIYTDALPVSLVVGDEVQYRIDDAYSDEEVLYPSVAMVIEAAPSFSGQNNLSISICMGMM
jgi:hypothetical protein